MDYIVDKVKFKIESLNKQQRYAFLSCLIAGFLSHGYALCNNYIYHDATILNGLGTTFGIGRWALGYMGVINDALLGNYHLPFFNILHRGRCYLIVPAVERDVVHLRIPVVSGGKEVWVDLYR